MCGVQTGCVWCTCAFARVGCRCLPPPLSTLVPHWTSSFFWAGWLLHPPVSAPRRWGYRRTELSQFYMNSGPYVCMKAFTTAPSPCPQLFLISKKRFVFMCMSLGVCMRAWWLWRPEEGGSPRADVINSCKMSVLERVLGPLHEHQVLLNTAPSLQPLPLLSFCTATSPFHS